MSGCATSSKMMREESLSNTCYEIGNDCDVPPNMRDYYYFCLLLSNLSLATTTDVLKSTFGSLPGFIHASADVDIRGAPLGAGEVIFADEATMSNAAKKMNNHIIDGTKIQVREMSLFDVKPEYFQGQC